jgi:hypothetical protein
MICAESNVGARKRITFRDGSMEKALNSPYSDFSKLLWASTGKNGYLVTLPDLGRGKLFLNEP